MIFRTLFLYFYYLKYRIKYRKFIWFRGFSVFYAFKGNKINFDTTGEIINIFSHPFSNMIGLQQRCILVAKGGDINIGSGVCMSGCTLYAMTGINIGRCTDIGAGCKIIDNDFHPLPYSQRHPIELDDKVKKRPINIGEGCFIGANSIILKGTNLGKNVVVGAGSVVSGTFPDNVIIAGNPAKILKNNLS